MNWVLNSESNVDYHTNLSQILKPINNNIQNFNWLLSNLEYTVLNLYQKELPIDFEKSHFLLSSSEFDIILKTDIQIIWGVIIAISDKVKLNIEENHIPYSDGNDEIWVENYFQNENAEIEIICFDSSCTIVKFRDKQLSDKFKTFFPAAIALKEYI